MQSKSWYSKQFQFDILLKEIDAIRWCDIYDGGASAGAASAGGASAGGASAADAVSAAGAPSARYNCV